MQNPENYSKKLLFQQFHFYMFTFLWEVLLYSVFLLHKTVQSSEKYSTFRSLRHVYTAILCRNMFACSTFIHLLLSSPPFLHRITVFICG